MENYNFDLGLTPPPAKKRSRVWKAAGTLTALVIVAGLLVYSGGMEYMLRLLGVGASGIYDVTLTNNRDFVGESKFFVDGSQPEIEGVSVFDQFSGTPNDPNQNEKNKGFVSAIFSSPQDPTQETYLEHFYVTSVIDLTLDTPLLSAVEFTDFNSAGSNINYAYRTSAQASSIRMSAWQVLDPSVVNSVTENGVKVRAAIVEQNVDRFVQLRFVFEDVDPMLRAAVYAVSLQYKEGEAIGDGMEGTDAVEREISLHYQPINAPTNADIDILSDKLNNQVVYTEKQVDLSERISYTFTTTLAPGAYALVVSGPTFETQIMPFRVGTLDEKIGVDVGSFTPPTGQDSVYDLNGDGVVNTLDLQLLMGKFTY
ncbi:hypothetical protein JXA59_00915 [Patescibacteria group bacterium]|nr:hypothetical protein [Patescibacteria group bacterium]